MKDDKSSPARAATRVRPAKRRAPFMPCVSRFYGISIYIYFRDHAPPHFHAFYGEFEAVVEIATGAIVAGELPRRARGLVAEWAALRRAELELGWNLAAASSPLAPIAPLE